MMRRAEIRPTMSNKFPDVRGVSINPGLNYSWPTGPVERIFESLANERRSAVLRYSTMTYLPIESFIIQRLQEGGWRVIHRRADRTDLPIADFVSHREAKEWVNWKSGHPKINPYATADE